MITLVFDTETTGLPNSKLTCDHPDQARIMQIAMLLLDDDKEVGCFYSRLLPDEWPPCHLKAYEAHGLTEGLCKDTGVQQALAINNLYAFIEACDVIVAHNIKFDQSLVDIEGGLLGLNQPIEKPRYCTMELMTPIMGLTRANGAIKWPNLAEALSYCVPGQTIDKAHDALSDVRATAKVWRWLINKGLVSI
jgi:DNA polymerase III subunit epsilon